MKDIIIMLHPYNTSIKDTKYCFKKINKSKSISKIFYPKSNFYYKNKNCSWLNYLQEFDGDKEDIIDIQCLIKQRLRIIYYIKRIMKKYNCSKNNIILCGISQGGCLALDIANYFKLKCVITIVSYRMTISCKKKLLSKWIAINAINDSIFKPEWCINSYKSANKIINVIDDHYLENTDIDTLFYNVIYDLGSGGG